MHTHGHVHTQSQTQSHSSFHFLDLQMWSSGYTADIDSEVPSDKTYHYLGLGLYKIENMNNLFSLEC